MKTITCLCLFIGSVCTAGSLPDAKITVKVVDENGSALTNAEVGIGFNQGGDAWIGEHKSETIRGLSDSNGLFSAQAKCFGKIGIIAGKDNFYRSSARQDYPGTYQGKKRWEPWNPTIKVVLKKVINPIPMYTKSIRTELSEMGIPIGYDLEKGDWVVPHGKGIHTDLLFQSNGWFKDFRDHDLILTLSFPNKGDGIQSFDAPVRTGSALRSSQVAPHDGYKPEWIWKSHRERNPESPADDKACVNTYDENKNYYFRVRTVLDENGNVVRACYGKIYGDIRFGGAERGDVWIKDFMYYFNPTPNDRNLEYYSEKNLFGTSDRFAP